MTVRLPVRAKPLGVRTRLGLTLAQVGDMQRLHCRHRGTCLAWLAGQRFGGLDCRACPVEEPIDGEEFRAQVETLAGLGRAIVALADRDERAPKGWSAASTDPAVTAHNRQRREARENA